MQDLEAQINLHHTLQAERKRILAEISLADVDLGTARSEFESAERRLESARKRDLELLEQLQKATLELWRIEWKLGRALASEDRSQPDGDKRGSPSRRYDHDIVLYDYQGDVPLGTIGTLFALEGKEVGKDVMFAAKPDGPYMVIDCELGEENGHRALTLHLVRIR